MRQISVVNYLLGMVVLCAGCSNQSSHIANPFYSPDRVPPPGTRSLAPGSAQPYYSGDPLPPLQSDLAAPPAIQPASATTAVPSKPLDWNTPTISNNAVTSSPVGIQPPMQPSGSVAPPPQPSAVNQEVLPVSWPDAPPASPTPRVRLPQTSGSTPAMPPLVGNTIPSPTDGFQPRRTRPAPY